jgi:predicted phage terminase large subunit-like protein
MLLSEAQHHDAHIGEARLLEALLRQKLGAFAERSFNELMPAMRFCHNWHLEALAYHLEEVAAGRCRRLLITLPPRSLKSLYASIAFPAWLLGRDPHRRIVCVSYAADLAVAHANSFRSLVNAPWYRALFPGMRIDPRKDTETEVRTSVGGYRLTTTVGGSLTGRGGSIIIIDDPMKAADAHSEAARRKVNAWFDETLLSRLDDKKSDAIILVMQRLHVDDLAGHVLAAGGWTHLDLPAISECEAVIPVGLSRVYHRPVDDVLHPDREPRAELENLRRSMGTAVFSAQYQQRPVPPGGNMIQWNWFGTWTQLPQKASGHRIVQSWDTASKASELADYSVGITALVTPSAVYLMDLVRERLDYPSLKRRIVHEKARWKADTILIEDKGSGISLIQDLKREGVFPIPILPDGDKVVRMSACSAKIEAGAVSLPHKAPWLGAFQVEILAFPYGAHDDQADALSQLLNWVRKKSSYTLDWID